MHTHQDATHLSLVHDLEQRMLRETYERAGREARANGVPRSANPFSTGAGTSADGAAEDPRKRHLARHWWDGWDSVDPASRRPRRSGP